MSVAALSMTDATGREVLNTQLAASHSTIDIGSLAIGIYSWRVVANGKVLTGKIAKE